MPLTTDPTPPRLITLILLTATSTLALNMFLPSLAQIARDLDSSYAVVSLALGGFLAVTALLQMILGPLSDRVGRRPVILGALAVFAVASVGCALADNVWVFLAFRMLQGAMTAGFALSMAIVRDTTPEREAAGRIGYISMAMAVAPMIGPMLGGVIDAGFGWRANFYLYALIGAGLLAWCWNDLGETRASHAPEEAGPPARARDLLRVPLFWAYAACGAFSTGAFYIFITGAPLVAQAQFGVSTASLGVFIGSITIGFATGGFLAGRWAPHVDPHWMMLAGRIVACGGLLVGIAIVLAGVTSPLLFFGSTIFVGLGNGLTMPSSNAAALSVRPALAGSAAGWNGALILAGGAALTTLTGAVLPVEAPGLMLLVLMLAASAAGLVAVLVAMRLCRGAAR